jgi:diguanylate cyclase (GGDEF)-like protein
MAFQRSPRLSVAVDLLTFLVCGVLAAVDLAGLIRTWSDVNPVLLLTIPFIVAMGLFPIRIDRLGGQIEFVCSPAVLMFLAFQTRPTVALALWILGYAVEQSISRRPLRSKLFNIGLSGIAGKLTILVVVDVSEAGRVNARALAAVVAGTAAYFVTDFVLTYVSVWTIQPIVGLGLLRDGAVWIGFAGLLGADAIGYTAVVLAGIHWYALLLVAPPIAAIFAARHAYEDANRHRSRLGTLFEAAVLSQQTTSVDEIEQVLVDQARRLLHAPGVRMRPTPPSGGEIGVAVPALDGQYLVAPPRPASRAYDNGDRESLAALAAIAAESFDRSRMAENMARMALIDPLTGVANRALFQQRLDVALKQRTAGRMPLVLLYLDLDGFKQVNDELGHHVGDALLRAVAQRLAAVVRGEDLVARIGGDEFAIVLVDADSTADADAVCRRAAEEIARPVDVGPHRVSVTVSVGRAAWVCGDSADDLVKRADHDMYRRKRAARARSRADGSPVTRPDVLPSVDQPSAVNRS